MLGPIADAKATAACTVFGRDVTGRDWRTDSDSIACACSEIPVSRHAGTLSALWPNTISTTGMPRLRDVGCFRCHPASSNTLATDFVNWMDSSSIKTFKVYSVPLKSFKAAISSSVRIRDRGVLSRYNSASALAARCSASARCDSASAACVFADVISRSNESASVLAPVARDTAFREAISDLLEKVKARDDAVAAEFADRWVSINTAWSKARILVSESLTKYSAIPSPATPKATSIHPSNAVIPTRVFHLLLNSMWPNDASSGQVFSQPLKSCCLNCVFQQFLAHLHAGLITSAQTSGSSANRPTTTATVEMIRILNQNSPQRSRSARIIASSFAAYWGETGTIDCKSVYRRTPVQMEWHHYRGCGLSKKEASPARLWRRETRRLAAGQDPSAAQVRLCRMTVESTGIRLWIEARFRYELAWE